MGDPLKMAIRALANFTTRTSSIYPIKTFSKAWKWQLFDFGPTFIHFSLLKNVKISWAIQWL